MTQNKRDLVCLYYMNIGKRPIYYRFWLFNKSPYVSIGSFQPYLYPYSCRTISTLICHITRFAIHA